jgi:hypothetical protein
MAGFEVSIYGRFWVSTEVIDLRQRLSLLVLPERRPSRCYPRVVKIKMSAYDKKWVRRRTAK